jgi:hypothetical protein
MSSYVEVSAITIEAGWKMRTLLTKYSAGIGCYAFAPQNPFDMVYQTIQLSNDGDGLVQRLNIVGHGSRGGISIGAHFVELSNLGNYAGHFAKLQQVLSGESFVHIQGCSVGQNEKLLGGLARAFGVPVYAATSAENVLWSFNFGDYKVAYPGGGVYDTDRP